MRPFMMVLALWLAACAPLPPQPTATPAATRAVPASTTVTPVVAAGATATAAPTPMPLPAPASPAASAESLIVTNHRAAHVSIIQPPAGVVARIEVGESPWGIAPGSGGIVYVSTAKGVAAVDIVARRRMAFAPFPDAAAYGGTGEYRPGGMGIALAPDGRQIAAGVYAPGGSLVHFIDTASMTVTGSARVGVRPFDVLFSPGGREAYSIDHDSYSVTAIDRDTLRTRTLRVAPLGGGAYDKPHYGAFAPDGRLLLPYQGRMLVSLDTADGSFTTRSLAANTHQHGVALSRDGRMLVIIGTGAAGSATGVPVLSLIDLAGGTERSLPLQREHERVALSADGRTAYLSGGYLLGGWDGITLVNLADGSAREIPVPDLPLDIAVLR